jgi:hypothetical protein
LACVCIGWRGVSCCGDWFVCDLTGVVWLGVAVR